MLAALATTSLPARIDAAAGALRIVQQEPKSREISAEVVRSPENETLTLKATFSEDTQGIKVSLFNLLGKLVEIHPSTTAVKGNNQFQFRTKGLPNGPYIVVLEAAGKRLVNKVMLSR